MKNKKKKLTKKQLKKARKFMPGYIPKKLLKKLMKGSIHSAFITNTRDGRSIVNVELDNENGYGHLMFTVNPCNPLMKEFFENKLGSHIHPVISGVTENVNESNSQALSVDSLDPNRLFGYGFLNNEEVSPNQEEHFPESSDETAEETSTTSSDIEEEIEQADELPEPILASTNNDELCVPAEFKVTLCLLTTHIYQTEVINDFFISEGPGNGYFTFLNKLGNYIRRALISKVTISPCIYLNHDTPYRMIDLMLSDPDSFRREYSAIAKSLRKKFEENGYKSKFVFRVNPTEIPSFDIRFLLNTLALCVDKKVTRFNSFIDQDYRSLVEDMYCNAMEKLDSPVTDKNSTPFSSKSTKKLFNTNRIIVTLMKTLDPEWKPGEYLKYRRSAVTAESDSPALYGLVLALLLPDVNMPVLDEIFASMRKSEYFLPYEGFDPDKLNDYVDRIEETYHFVIQNIYTVYDDAIYKDFIRS